MQEVAAAFIEDPQHAGVVIGNDRPALTLQEGLGIADGDLGEDLPVDLDTSGRCRGVDAIDSHSVSDGDLFLAPASLHDCVHVTTPVLLAFTAYLALLEQKDHSAEA